MLSSLFSSCLHKPFFSLTSVVRSILNRLIATKLDQCQLPRPILTPSISAPSTSGAENIARTPAIQRASPSLAPSKFNSPELPKRLDREDPSHFNLQKLLQNFPQRLMAIGLTSRALQRFQKPFGTSTSIDRREHNTRQCVEIDIGSWKRWNSIYRVLGPTAYAN